MKLSGNAALIDHETASYRRFTAIALVTALALLGGFVIFAQPEAANPPLIPKNTRAPMYPDLPGVVDNYPPIVGYVDGLAIPGELLAIRVAALEQSVDPTVDKSHLVRDALHNIIRDQILTDHAQDYGVSVSYDEAHAEAQREKALVLSNPNARADTALLAQSMGVSVDDYFDLPSVIQSYRNSMTLGVMESYILNHAPVADRDSEAKEQAALDAFVDGIHAKVQVLIIVP